MNIKDRLLNIGIFEDNKYLEKYCDLILNNRNSGREVHITQRHHIIPKYYYNHNNLEIDNTKENIVNLTYKDHILAHYYLALCSKSKLDWYSNMTFLNRVINRYDLIEDLDLIQNLYEEYKRVASCKRKIKHDQYLLKKKEDLEKWIIEKHTCERCGKVMTIKYASGRFCSRNCANTHPHTAETKAMLSTYAKEGICGMKGRELSDQAKRNHSTAMLGKNKGKHWYTNGIKTILISDLDLIPDGFYPGCLFNSSRPAWNRGLTSSDERVKINSEHRKVTMLKKYGSLYINNKKEK